MATLCSICPIGTLVYDRGDVNEGLKQTKEQYRSFDFEGMSANINLTTTHSPAIPLVADLKNFEIKQFS